MTPERYALIIINYGVLLKTLHLRKFLFVAMFGMLSLLILFMLHAVY